MALSGSACQLSIGTTKQGWPVRASRCLRDSALARRRHRAATRTLYALAVEPLYRAP
jgi:hypothetical protein